MNGLHDLKTISVFAEKIPVYRNFGKLSRISGEIPKPYPFEKKVETTGKRERLSVEKSNVGESYCGQ